MILIIHLFKKIGIFEINIKQAKINIFHLRIIKLKSHTNIMTRTDIYDIFFKTFFKNNSKLYSKLWGFKCTISYQSKKNN